MNTKNQTTKKRTFKKILARTGIFLAVFLAVFLAPYAINLLHLDNSEFIPQLAKAPLAYAATTTIQCDWAGANGGSWNTAANWNCTGSTHVVPKNNGTTTVYYVNIQTTNRVVLDTTVSLAGLNVGTTSSGAVLDIGGSGNSSTITMVSTGTAPSGFTKGAMIVGSGSTTGTVNLIPATNVTCLTTVVVETVTGTNGTITGSTTNGGTCTWDHNANVLLTNAGTMSGTFNMAIAGGITNNGTINMSGGTFTADTNTPAITCSATRANNVFWNWALNVSETFAGSCTFGGTMTVATAKVWTTGAGTHEFTSNTVAAPLVFSGTGSMTVTAGNTMIFSGTGASNAVTIPTTANSATISYANLQLAPTTSGSTYTINSGTLTATGALTIGDGSHTVTVTASTNNPTMNITGATTIASSGTFTTGTGTWTQTGDLTIDGTLSGTASGAINAAGAVSGTGTVNLTTAGTFTQRAGASKNFGTTSGSNNWNFFNLIFSNSSVSSITYTTQSGGSGTITVGGAMQIGKAGDTGGTVLGASNRTWILSGTPGSSGNTYPTIEGRTNSNNTTATTAHTVNFDTTPSDGDLLIVAAGFDGDPGTITWPAGWTQLSLTANGTTVAQEIRYRVASGDSSSISISTVNSVEMQTRSWRLGAGEYTGVPQVGTASTGTSVNPDPPSVTASWGSDTNYFISVVTADGAKTASVYPTNYTIAQGSANSGGTTGNTIAYAGRQLTGATDDPSAFTISGSVAWIAQTIVIRGYPIAADVMSFNGSSSLTGSTSTFRYTGNAATVACNGANYYDLQLYPASSGSANRQSICLTTGKTLSVSHNLTVGDGTHAGASAATNDPTINVTGALTVAANATFISTGGTLTVGGAFTKSGSFSDNAGTVAMSTGSSIVNSSGTFTFNNLNTTGTVTANGSNALSVLNNFTINSGTFTSTPNTLTIGNTFTNNGTFTHNSGTIAFNTPDIATIAGSSSTTFNNFTDTVTGSTLLFTNDAGGTTPKYTFAGTVTITGAVGDHIIITSDNQPTNSWLAHFNSAVSTITHVDVSYSDCDGTSATVTLDSDSTLGSGNGSCWFQIQHPSEVSGATVTAGNNQNSLAWTNSTDINLTALGLTPRGYYGIAVDSITHDVYMAVTGGDIYKQTAGTGAFNALGQAFHNWDGLAVDSSNHDVYAVSYYSPSLGYGIFKQTGGTGSFTLVSGTDSIAGWTSIAVDSNTHDVYATDNSVFGIYKQTGGSGSFSLVSGTNSRGWTGIGIDSSTHDVYANDANSSDMYKQTGGTGSFVARGVGPNRQAIAVDDTTHDVYTVYNSDVYKQSSGSGSFISTRQTSRTWGQIAIDQSTKDFYANVYGGGSGDIYKNVPPSTIVLRRTTSAVTDAPVDGATYSIGNTIGSSTVVCLGVQTSCTDTSLSNGTAYYYKIFTLNIAGNYSVTGVVPTGSPATPTVTTLGTGTDTSSSTTIGPGSSATEIDRFSLVTSAGTNNITGVTVTLAPTNAYTNIGTVSVTNVAGNTTYCSASPSSNVVSLTSCTITATTSPTDYVVKITPLSHAAMPAVPGASYATTATVTAITATNATTGSDTNSVTTVTVDNASPAGVTSSTATVGNTVVNLAWTNPADSDFTTGGTVVVLRRTTSVVTDVPVEGTTYSVGNTIGSSTVACKVTGSPPATTCQDTGLSNGTPYYYKIFTEDSRGNYDAGTVPTGSPVTPSSSTPPTVTTQSASSVTSITATLNGNITATGGATPTVRGFLWGTNSSLVGGDTATTVENGSFSTGAFTNTSLTLVCNTTYYSRAYATNAAGTGYGAISASFTTGSCLNQADYRLYNSSTSDGTTWTSRTAPIASNIYAITYGNGLFVAVAATGTGNRVMTSVDGITWTTRTTPQDNTWISVTYGNGIFVAVSADGTNRVMTSPNGITWTARSASQANTWQSVTYGNGLFVAVAANGSNRVMTSNDGITWTNQTASSAFAWKAVTYGNGLFVAVANDAVPTTSEVMTSPDGTTWTTRTNAAEAFAWWSVTFGGGTYVAVGTGGAVMTSTDGITWTSRTSADVSQRWRGVNYGNGLFVAVGDASATYKIMTSPDGINWTGRSNIGSAFIGVVNGGGVWVTVAYSGNGVATSGDNLGTPLASQNTAGTLSSSGDLFRLRELIANTGSSASASAQKFKLQYALKSGTCDTAFSGETYYDVTNNSPISYSDLYYNIDEQTLSSTATDPSGGRTIVNQTYQTHDLFTNPSTIPAGQDGLWDFTLKDNGATPATSYCIRTVKTSTSTTASSWSSGNTINNQSYFAIAYGNGTFVTLNDGGNQVQTSSDGISWVERSAALTKNWITVIYANGQFVALAGDQAGNNNDVMISSDGISWSAKNAAQAGNWVSIAYGNGKYVAISNSLSGSTQDMYSSDGTTWVSGGAMGAHSWQSITYGNGLFVAVSTDGYVNYSPDAINWYNTAAPQTNYWNSVTFGNGLFVAVASTGSNRVMTSADGINWSSQTAAEANSWNKITYGNGVFVAVSYDGTNHIMISSDGISWSAKNDAGLSDLWTGIAYGKGIFVAVTDSGSGNTVRSSSADTLLDIYTNIPEIITSSITVTQASYRWRIDNGSETSAPYSVDENLPLTSGVYIGDTRRLRILVSNTGGGATLAYRLEYSSGACSAWAQVPSSGDNSGAWVMTASGNISNASATSDSTGLTNPAGKTFQTGYAMTTTSQTPSLFIPTSKFTELEYSVSATSNVSTGTTYCFRLTNAGDSNGFTYTQVPQIIAFNLVFRSRGGGSSSEGPSNPPDPQTGGGSGGGSGGSGGSTTAGGTAVLSSGSVASVTITAGGNYSTPPLVSFCVSSGSPGSGATGTAVLTGTAVTSVTINSSGSNYSTPPTVVFGGTCGGAGGGAGGGDSGYLYVPNHFAFVEIPLWIDLKNLFGFVL